MLKWKGYLQIRVVWVWLRSILIPSVLSLPIIQLIKRLLLTVHCTNERNQHKFHFNMKSILNSIVWSILLIERREQNLKQGKSIAYPILVTSLSSHIKKSWLLSKSFENKATNHLNVIRCVFFLFEGWGYGFLFPLHWGFCAVLHFKFLCFQFLSFLFLYIIKGDNGNSQLKFSYNRFEWFHLFVFCIFPFFYFFYFGFWFVFSSFLFCANPSNICNCSFGSYNIFWAFK